MVTRYSSLLRFFRLHRPVLAFFVRTSWLLFALLWVLSACGVKRSSPSVVTEIGQVGERSSTITPTQSLQPTGTQEPGQLGEKVGSIPESNILGGDVKTATQTPTKRFTQTHTPPPTVTSTSTTGSSTYPGPIEYNPAYPGINPGPINNNPTYPGVNPGLNEQPAYPGSNTYPGTTQGIFNAGSQTNPTVPPPISMTATTIPTASLAQNPPATSFPSSLNSNFSPRSLSQNGETQVLTIWHSLEYPQLAALEDIIRSFQLTFPQVSFDLTYVPLDDLKKRYAGAVYQKEGPDLLLAPSAWSAELYDQGLATNLSPYFTATFWRSIIPPALGTGSYKLAQVSLPVTMSGIVMYRNQAILPQPSTDFESMVNAARLVTHGGIVGAYFELDPFYSMAHLDGLGGQWQDSRNGEPVFQRRDYAEALGWLDLLQDFDRLGAVELNTSRDTALFRQGKVGLIIDGSWNMESIIMGLGREKLAVDPWPSYGSGRLSGYVFTQGLFLNVETARQVDSQLLAALQFMGSMLLPQSQLRMAEEVGVLPVLQSVQVPDRIKNQAITALNGGVAFPTIMNGQPFEVYRAALQVAISQSLSLPPEQPKSEIEALQEAYAVIAGWFTSQSR